MWDPLPVAAEWRVEFDVEDHAALHRALDRLRERALPERSAS
jgi:hypothetical protein